MKFQTRLTLLIYNEDRSNHLRGETQIILPFQPTVGIHIQIDGMHPIRVVKVTWLDIEQKFLCIAEEATYKFDMDMDIDALTDDLDIVRDAKKLGWDGFNKIYRDK